MEDSSSDNTYTTKGISEEDRKRMWIAAQDKKQENIVSETCVIAPAIHWRKNKGFPLFFLQWMDVVSSKYQTLNKDVADIVIGWYLFNLIEGISEPSTWPSS